MFYQNHTEKKLKTKRWHAGYIEYLYLHGGYKSLLEGKNVSLIEKYAAGNQPMDAFEKLFKTTGGATNLPQSVNAIAQDVTGIDFAPLPILPQYISPATSQIRKTPLSVRVTAIDALAIKKRKTDKELIAYTPQIMDDLGEIETEIGIPAKPPTPANMASPVNISNLDLDPKNPDEIELYYNLWGNLRPEAALENVVSVLSEYTEYKKTKDLQIVDQMRFGVSTQRSYFSQITGLPCVDYIHPKNVFTPISDLPDFSDTDGRYIMLELTASQVMNSIGNELTEDEIGDIFNEYYKKKNTSYNWHTLKATEKYSQRIPILYVEFVTFDRIKIAKYKNQNGNEIEEEVDDDFFYPMENPRYNKEKAVSLRAKMDEVKDKKSTAYYELLRQYKQVKKNIPAPETEEKFTYNKYEQYTLSGYWFPCKPEKVYNSKKLEGSQGIGGLKPQKPFSIDIYKSSERGKVEMCIPIANEIQRAFIKQQHALITARPSGASINIDGLLNAVSILKSSSIPYSFESLLKMYVQKGLYLWSHAGENPDDKIYQKPLEHIPANALSEVTQYATIIQEGFNKISKITGINDGLLGGVQQNPEGLVGLQKLLLQSSINSLSDIQEAIKMQAEVCYKGWVPLVQHILSNKNSENAKALIAMIGHANADTIKDLEDVPNHIFTLKVEAAPNIEAQERLKQEMMVLVRNGGISLSNFFTINRIFNTKDAELLLAIIEKKRAKERSDAQMADITARQQSEMVREQNKLSIADTMAKGEIAEEQIKAQNKLQILQMQQEFLSGLQKGKDYNKLIAQRERISGQIEKQRDKHNLQIQTPI